MSVLGARAGIILWTSLHGHKAHKSLFGSVVLQTGILQVSQEARNFTLQRKGNCHFYALTVFTLDSSGSGKDNEDGFWNDKYDNRAPEQISTERGHR